MDNKNLTLKWIDTLGNNKIVFERGIIAVSYTHLDVYKRHYQGIQTADQQHQFRAGASGAV